MERIVILKNESSVKNIGDEFWPTIDNAISFLEEVLQDNLIEIRLLGSIPRGDAILGNSDIDFLAITKEKVSEEAVEKIREKAAELSQSTLVVTKVDLEYMSQKEIKQHFEYELIVKTDSICIYGKDAYTVNEYRILNTDLAKLWDPGINMIITSYREHLLSHHLCENEIKRYSRFTGKDLMKCFRKRVLIEHGIMERSVEKIYLCLKKYLPEYACLFDSLWDLYRFPTDNIDKIVKIINEAEEAKDKILCIK